MTSPCVDPEFFDTPDGVLTPQRRWQWAHRATAEAGGASFVPANNAAGTTLFTTDVSWINNSGVSQQVYATMTTGPARFQIDQLKHLVIQTQWGVALGAGPPTLTGESRIRGYADLGTQQISGSTVGVWGVMEDRQPTLTVPVGDVLTVAAAGQISARVQVRWFTTAWGLDWHVGTWGDPIPYRQASVGAVRLDLYSVPVIP
ncbi:DUF7172 family protein [Nocardia carnea]|uniref:DUF7172 family protein n=1 Tax=Nocardia carnea TaxID=37328 RepID=UPI002458B30C|nr:hypothetical protein [Nocardia carnea]